MTTIRSTSIPVSKVSHSSQRPKEHDDPDYNSFDCNLEPFRYHKRDHDGRERAQTYRDNDAPHRILLSQRTALQATAQ
jgi:hypothetical protein